MRVAARREKLDRAERVALPVPVYTSQKSVEMCLHMRRSVREHIGEPLTLAQVAQLLWAAQGVTDETGLRTTPSAGALYPLELYAVAGNVENLRTGIYRYDPASHQLILVLEGDPRRELCRAALDQTVLREAAFLVVLAAVYERSTKKYGQRGQRYVHMEVGHAAQNICLQAVSLRLGAVVIGAFEDAKVKKVLHVENEEEPLSIVAIGRM